MLPSIGCLQEVLRLWGCEWVWRREEWEAQTVGDEVMVCPGVGGRWAGI